MNYEQIHIGQRVRLGVFSFIVATVEGIERASQL